MKLVDIWIYVWKKVTFNELTSFFNDVLIIFMYGNIKIAISSHSNNDNTNNTSSSNTVLMF